MILISILVSCIVMYCIGRSISSLKFLRLENKNIGFCCILGFLICLAIGEILHMGAVFLQFPVDKFVLIYGGILLSVFIFSIVILCWKKEKILYIEDKKWFIQFFAFCLIIIPLLLLKQPNFEYDMIAEQVGTMLQFNSFGEINPLTGSAYELGVPTRIKILGFPSILVAVCEWFSLSVQECLTVFTPIISVVITCFVYYQWGLYFWGEKEKSKVSTFMTIVVMLILLGQSATFMPSYGLFHMGYRPEVIVQNIVYPMMILMALKKKYCFLVLGCVVEVGLVWTFYGLGMGVFFCGCIIIVTFILSLIEKRKVEKC